MWPRIVAGIFIPVGNHYFQALASTLQFVAQVCDRLWFVPATDRAFAYITYMSPPHVALVCSGPPQCAATCGWTKWPVCSGPYCFFLLVCCSVLLLRPICHVIRKENGYAWTALFSNTRDFMWEVLCSVLLRHQLSWLYTAISQKSTVRDKK